MMTQVSLSHDSKKEEDWRFGFWNNFVRFRVFTFLYYANEESDDVVNMPTSGGLVP